MSLSARFFLTLLACGLAAQDFSRELPWIVVDVRALHRSLFAAPGDISSSTN